MDYRNELIERVLALPASLCPEPYQDFTVRGDTSAVINWNKKMISDQGLDIRRLRDLTTIVENRADLMGLTSKVIKT